MGYYQYKDHILYTEETLAWEKLERLPAAGEVLYLFRRPPLTGRETFAVTAPALLTAAEGPETLCSLDKVEQVRLLVEGEALTAYGGLDLSGPLLPAKPKDGFAGTPS